MLIHNARIILPDRVQLGSLVLEDGRISKILDSVSVESVSTDSTIDLNGAALLPGFIDIHIHGAIGVDVNRATADDLRHVSEFLATKGVTAWLPTLVPAPEEDYERAVATISELAVAQTSVCESSDHSDNDNHRLKSMPLARVLGVHYEGPFVNGEQCGALHRDHFRTLRSVADLDSLAKVATPNAIHMMTVAPEIEGGIELIRELRRRGWIVSIGHTRATPEILDQAKAAGAQHMTHFMNAMSPLHHRAPGPVGWGLLNDHISLDIIADGVHLDPMMLRVLLRTVTPERLALISDAIAAAGQGDGDYEIWGERITVENGGTRNTRGSIAGSVITILDAVRMMLSLGASECDVARMASLNPARLLGIDQDCGSIEEGKRADLIALDRTGQVALSVLGGNVLSPARTEPF